MIFHGGFTHGVKVMELRGYDLILGMDWLEQWGAMTCHWKNKWVQFQYKNERIKLQGVQTPTHIELK